MRTATLFSAAALAGCAFASPLMKRDDAVEVETVYDYVNTVAYVTVTATATAAGGAVEDVTSTVVAQAPTSAAPAPVEAAPAAVEPSSAPAPEINQNNFKYKEHKYTWAWTSTYYQEAPQATTEAAPAPETSAYQAPEAETSVYEAPVEETTSEAAYVAPTTSTSVPVQKSSAADYSAPAKATSYSDKVVVHHNIHRANHSAPDLTWSDSLAATAQKIAESCVYAHDVETDGGGYGQNIAAGVEADNVSAVITDLFYNGEVDYFKNLYGQKSPDMSNFHAWGHFSQIVWKATTQVGCATVDCGSKGLANTGSSVSPIFTVCNYKTPGNSGGQYADNVLEPLNNAAVDSSYGV